MLVTATVFHSTMLPYVIRAAVASVTQAVTAVPMLEFVMHTAHATEPTVHVSTVTTRAVFHVLMF
jgi:hypothetical protein